MAQQPSPFDFWAPTYTASDGTLYSPGFIGNTFLTDDPWSLVYFATAPTPGQAEVTVEKARDVDKKKAAGSDGARLTLHGIEPAMIEMRLTIWTPEQLKALKDLWPLLMVPAYKMVTTTSTIHGFGQSKTTATVSGGNVSTVTVPTLTTQTTKTTSKIPVTFDVSHPMFKLHGISAVQIVGGRGPDPGPTTRSRVFTIRAVEFLPPTTTGKSATKTDDAPLSSGNALTYGFPVGNTDP